MRAAWECRGWGAGGDEGGAVCVRGVRRGAVSRPFRAADLLRATAHAAHTAHTRTTVFVDVDSAGYLVACGAGGAGGAAALAARASLAPHPLAADALVAVCAHAHTNTKELLLEVVVQRARAPHDALRLWLDERLPVALPHLQPAHIRGDREYRCDVCLARFPDPNPLKVHLLVRCGEPTAAALWRAVAASLHRPPPPPPPPLDPARVEALAAEWGRAHGAAGSHACLYCGKLYSRKYGLKIHIRTHTGYRPLRCRHCARAFGDPSNLNKHVRLHDAQRGGGEGGALSCRVCGKALARRRDLERHLRTHTARDPRPAPRDTHNTLLRQRRERLVTSRYMDINTTTTVLR